MINLPEGVGISRIINYLRRSREDVEREKRTGEDTIAMQRAVMERVLQQYGLPYDQAIEIGSGDKIETRPVFQQVLHDLENERYNCIAVKEMSRLTRGDFRDYGYVYELIRRKRIYILTPYRLYDPKNVNDMRQIRFEMFLSREEFETIRERMQGAKHTYARSGRFMGSTPAYGYRADERTQRLLICPEEAEVVRLIFQLYLRTPDDRSLGYRSIAAYLTKCGIQSPSGLGAWNATTIKNILHNPVYIGEIHYNTTTETNKRRIKKEAHEWIVVPDAHCAIISRDVFQQVGRKKRNFPLPSLRMDHPLHELTGLIRCVRCGKKMVRQSNRTTYLKQDGNRSYYEKEILWCNTAGCTYVKYRAVEEKLLAFLAQIPCPSWEEIVLQKKQEAAPSDAWQMLQRQQSELAKQLDAIYGSYESGIYTAAEFDRRRTLILEKTAHVNEWLQEMEQNRRTNPQPSCAYPHKSGQLQLENFAQAYRLLPRKELKNRLLHLLIESIHLERLEKKQGQRATPFSLSIAYRFHEAIPLRPKESPC